MLFSEIYSLYYRAISRLIERAIEEDLNTDIAAAVIRQTAFSESEIYILDAVKKQQWQVITKDFKTPIKRAPQTPLSDLEKRFLKAISLDKRFQLFAESSALPMEMEDVEPLFTEQDFYYFDIIKDGDPYDEEEYIYNFRMVVKALQQHRRIKIAFKSAKGNFTERIYTPRNLEYSHKDDKFRLICYDYNRTANINMARIKSCEILSEFDPARCGSFRKPQNTVVLKIYDERGALERSMLHFANFEKTTKQLGGKQYRMELRYNKEDETEVLIRILSFGPMLKVTEPESFVTQIKTRLEKQKKLQTV